MDAVQATKPYLNKAIELVMEYGPKLILAILVLIIGLWIIKGIKKLVTKALQKGQVEISLQKFLVSMITVLLKVLLLISVASMVGIATTSFIAILGAATFAIGLALQGSMSNFAGGVLILLLKPFKVGDTIEAQGFLGKVHEIQIFNTIMKTFDNKMIFIPNGTLSNGNITNYSMEPIRRVDMTFGIGYGDDIKKTNEVLTRLIQEDSRILKDPAPLIAVSSLGDSSVNFAVKVWCDNAQYWDVYYDMQEKVKLTCKQMYIYSKKISEHHIKNTVRGIIMRKLIVICLLILFIFVPIIHAQFMADLESGLNLSGYNDVRVPGDTGSPFSLQKDIGSNASMFFRTKLSYTFAKRHTVYVLLAPFTKTYKGELKQIIVFADSTFSKDFETKGKYKFNSWRLSYRWDFINSKKFQVGVGLTGMIRDTKITLIGKYSSDGGITGVDVESSKSNVGFLPLINFLFAWKFTPCMGFRIEGDAIVTPHGRAEDILFAWTGCISDKVSVKLGYRFLEGGADKDAVYNYALFHHIVFGVMFRI